MHEPLQTASAFLNCCAPWLGNQHSRIPRTHLHHQPGSQSLCRPWQYHVLLNIWKEEWLPIYLSSPSGATGTVWRAGTHLRISKNIALSPNSLKEWYRSSLPFIRGVLSAASERKMPTTTKPLEWEVVQTPECGANARPGLQAPQTHPCG